MSKNKAVILFVASFFITGNLLISQEGSTFFILAEYKEKINEMIFANGNVEIHYKDVILSSDWVELNTETKDVYAWGNVSLHLPDEFLTAEEIRMNLDSSEAELKKAFGRIQPSISYEAEEIKRNNENVYSFRKASITSCTQPNPRWQFSCSKANFKKDDYIEMWGTVLTIKKVPVFYFPYLRYPLDRERATGFLMPQIGFSGQKGFNYSQSYYWAMRRNMDATLNADYYSEKGIGGGLEYRYILSKGVRGQLNLYYFRFNEEPGLESSKASIIRFNHKQNLPLGFSLVADVDYSSSFDFLKEFDNDFKRAVVSNRRSQVYLSKSWSYFNLNARVSRFETYSRSTDQSVIRYSLPEISFRSSKIKLFNPLYFSFNSSFQRWEYGKDYEYENGTQMKSESLFFKPELTLPFTPIPWLTLNSTLYSNLTYNFQSYAPGTTDVVNESLFVPQYGFNAELIGPVFYKTFQDAKGEARLKHIIEPTIEFRYESPVDDADRIINYRRYYRYHQISYGLTNRILVKQGKMPREMFVLGLKQTYHFSPEDSPLSLYQVDGDIDPFSDISGYLRFYPARKYSFDISGAYNPQYDTFTRFRVGARYGSINDNAFLRVYWFRSINPYYEGVTYDRHQINLYGGLKMPRLLLDIEAEMNYNIQDKELLYTGFAIVHHYQCLDIRAEVKVFYYRAFPETQFRISIGLGNIGKTMDFLGGLGF